MISRAKKYVAVLLVFVCVCMIFSSLTCIYTRTVRSMKLSKPVSLLLDGYMTTRKSVPEE